MLNDAHPTEAARAVSASHAFWQAAGSELHAALPAPSSDIAGAFAALRDLGALVIVHGPAACLETYAACDEPRLVDQPARLFASGLGEAACDGGRLSSSTPCEGGGPSFSPADSADLVPRDSSAVDTALVERACALWDAVGGAFIAIVGTPFSTRVGTGYPGAVRAIEAHCGVPTIVLLMRGCASYPAGVSQALLAVAQMLMRGGARPSRRSSHTVNLLGATPLDVARQADVDEARVLLEASSWRVVSCWGMGSDVGALMDGMATAQANVVLTSAALPLARWMRAELGIPYVWGTLSGAHGPADLIARLGHIAAGEDVPAYPGRRADAVNLSGDPDVAHSEGAGRRALVVADPVLAESLRGALEDDLGFSQVDIATAVPLPADVAALFAEDAAAGLRGAEPAPDPLDASPASPRGSRSGLPCRGDLGCIDEVRLTQLMAVGTYDIVVGDPALAALMDVEAPAEASSASNASTPAGLVSEGAPASNAFAPAGSASGGRLVPNVPATMAPRLVPIPQVGLGGRTNLIAAATPYGPRFLDAVRRALT